MRYGTYMPLIWEAPPGEIAESPTDRLYTPMIEELRTRPNEWAVLSEFSSRSGSNKAKQRIRARFGKWVEFQVRQIEPGKPQVKMYARWIGPAQ